MLGEARRPQGQALAARAWYQQRLRSYTRFVSLVDRFFVAGRSLWLLSLYLVNWVKFGSYTLSVKPVGLSSPMSACAPCLGANQFSTGLPRGFASFERTPGQQGQG